MTKWEYKIMRLEKLSNSLDKVDLDHGGSMYYKDGIPIEFSLEKVLIII